MKPNPYLDLNYVDRTEQVEREYAPTLNDIQNDPEFYAELVNDLLFHWVYGTRETALMITAKKNLLNRHQWETYAAGGKKFSEMTSDVVELERAKK
jgi:hypothetical protein